jgi:hypothetical protein
VASLDKEVKRRLTSLVASALDGIDANNKELSRPTQEGVFHFLRLATGSEDEALGKHASDLIEGKGGLKTAKPVVVGESVAQLFADIYYHGSGITQENGHKVKIWLETGELPEIRKT